MLSLVRSVAGYERGLRKLAVLEGGVAKEVNSLAHNAHHQRISCSSSVC
jgi:hypothetical protein